jgi:site-specific DNA recombinase
MQKAVAYLRVSSQGQVAGTGFDRQRELCGRYAEKYNFHIVETYREEGVSGASDETERPAFQKMLEALLGNGIRVIIVEGLDRLARTLQVQETLLIFLASKDLELHSARTEDNITASMQEDPMKKALIQIQGVFSELEKNLLVNKLRKARDKIRAEKGRCEGVAPYGDEDPDEALIVERILKMRRSGRSYRAIAMRLNELGVRTRHDRDWQATQIKRICDRAIKKGDL